MSKKFEKLFKISRETVGPKEGEKIPSGLKRNAVEAMFLANVVEPQAFQLGAVKMANLILQSEKEGTSRHWMNWLAEEDVAELEKALFDLKNNTHAKHNVNPDPKSVRSQDEMYKLFKNYVSEGNYILQVIEHNVGHIIDVDDIQDILQWVDHRRSHMTGENSEYRTLLQAGNSSLANSKLVGIYRGLIEEFVQSELYREKVSQMDRSTRDKFNFAIHRLFLGTF